MYGVMHPFSKAVYEVDESGAVADHDDGRPRRPLPARRLMARRRGVRRRSAAVQLGRRRSRPAPPPERTEGELTMTFMRSHARRPLARCARSHRRHPPVPLRRQGGQGGIGQGVDRPRPPGRGPRLRELPHGRPLRQPARGGAGADGRRQRHQLAPGRPARRRRRLPQPGAVRQGVRHHRPAERGAVHARDRRRLVGEGLRHRRHPPGQRADPHRPRPRGGADHEGAVGRRPVLVRRASTTRWRRSTPCPSRRRASRS